VQRRGKDLDANAIGNAAKSREEAALGQFRVQLGYRLAARRRLGNTRRVGDPRIPRLHDEGAVGGKDTNGLIAAGHARSG
jgi:hypothetical protein